MKMINNMSLVAIDPLASTEVFKLIKVGNLKLSNRIVLAPSTRLRNSPVSVPSDLQLEYYNQRSKYPGSLLISEATLIRAQDLIPSSARFPAIFNDEQTEAWKKIVEKVHSNGSYISNQLFSLGRVANPESLKNSGFDFTGVSPIYPNVASEEDAIKAGNPLREMTIAEILEFKKNCIEAAKRSIEAGFDFVEFHAANGYLLSQFLEPSSNQREDKYGGSLENRGRLLLEIIDEATHLLGAEKLAVRFSPWFTFQGLKGANELVSPVTTYSYLLKELNKRAFDGKEIAYVSLVEPRVSIVTDEHEPSTESNDFVHQAWDGVVLRTGSYIDDAPKLDILREDISKGSTLIGFSRYFTSNPDLVNRLKNGYLLTPYDRSTFYTATNWGYASWSNHDQVQESSKEEEEKRVPKRIE